MGIKLASLLIYGGEDAVIAQALAPQDHLRKDNPPGWRCCLGRKMRAQDTPGWKNWANR